MSDVDQNPDDLDGDLTYGRDAIKAALRQERIEITRIIEAEASEHEDAAKALREDYLADDEAHLHECDARMLNRIADMIRARTHAAPEPPEPKF